MSTRLPQHALCLSHCLLIWGAKPSLLQGHMHHVNGGSREAELRACSSAWDGRARKASFESGLQSLESQWCTCVVWSPTGWP